MDEGGYRVGLADEVEETDEVRRVPYQKCQLDAARAALSEDEAHELMALVARKDVAALSISRVLAKRGIKVSHHCVYRSRNENCSCCRRWVESHGS